MANFNVQIRRDYRDLTGLVLDLQPADLANIEGTHTGINAAAILEDDSANWVINEHVGKVIYNLTDGSHGVITANTATTITATLSGGTGNVWDTGDAYSLQGGNDGILRWPNRAPAARVDKPEYSGNHDGANNAAILSDSNSPWTGMNLVGMAVHNLTDGSRGWITANTATTITATLSGGTENDWDTGDLYLIADPRFGDAYSSSGLNQPAVRTVSGLKLIEFTRAFSSRIYAPLETAFPPTWWTIALELWKGTSVADNQRVLEMGTTIGIWRRSAGGVAMVRHGSSSLSSGADHPDGVAILRSINTGAMVYWQNGAILIDGSTPPTAVAVAIPANDQAIWIGCDSTPSNYFDGRIQSVRIWSRPLSPLELDFVWKSIASDGTNYATESRATITLKTWTDTTGNWSRLTRQQAAAQRFVLATVSNRARIQLAAAVNGKVRPDSELGGNLFQISLIESPGHVPEIRRDSGWSAIFDLILNSNYPGHYCYSLSRQNGGVSIVHFDVEAA